MRRCVRWVDQRLVSSGCVSKGDDSLLAIDVVVEGADLVTVTDGGFAKRTSVDQWATKGQWDPRRARDEVGGGAVPSWVR